MVPFPNTFNETKKQNKRRYVLNFAEEGSRSSCIGPQLKGIFNLNTFTRDMLAKVDVHIKCSSLTLILWCRSYSNMY